MKKVLVFLMIFLSVACQEKEGVQDIEEPQKEKKEFKMAAINVCGDTDYADFLLLSDNGSYILCDAENKEGYSVIYINESIDNDYEDGITLFLDEKGTPVMASSSNGHFIYKNVKEDSYDFAFINNQEEITYYHDVKLDFLNESSFATRGFFDPWIDAFKSPLGGGWDEHNKKAIVPFLCKVVSFAITASDAVWGKGQSSLIQTFIHEAYKSSNDRNKVLDDLYDANGMLSLGLSGIDLEKFLQNGTIVFTPEKFGLPYLAFLLNEYGDSELEKLGQYDDWVDPVFNTEEWKIRLSTNLLECQPDDEWYFVDVSSKALWDIDESQIDHNWCEVKKLDVQVAVHVKPNESANDRTCNLSIYAKTSSEISPVTLTIKQTGIVFELSEDKLSFTQGGGSKGVYVSTNDNVKSWDITSYPSWCKIEKANNSFFVNVDEYEEENREGVITITALTKGGMSVDRHINVEQVVIPLCPDNNHPHAIDLGLPSGTKWACCNVGASAPEGYGNYYAWGETQPKSVYNSDTYQYYQNDKFVNIGSDIAGTRYDAATANWGVPWQMPSKAQCQELINNTTSLWAAQNGVIGRKFTGPNGGAIFLPVAGYRSEDELYFSKRGYYWSSTLSEQGEWLVWYLYFNTGGGIDLDYGHRLCGQSVRPVR